MATFTETSIATIGALSVRWPDRETGLLQWTALHDVVDGCRDAVRAAGQEIDAIAADGDLSPAGQARRKLEAVKRILATFLSEIAGAKLTRARNAVEQYVAKLDEQMNVAPPLPSNAVEELRAQEIRSAIRNAGKGRSYNLAKKHSEGRPDVMAAIMAAPAFLSGLTGEEQEALGSEMAQRLYPELVQRRAEVLAALGVAEAAVKAAEGRILGVSGASANEIKEMRKAA
ncbi:hypothetical protein [Oceanibaculum sp.]|uniref:hypothetical protein n=1 Tax=Oceanibaculum sp. TaxID=1903597 RepID=UPI00258BCA80|nr:hypothetical protein [Oceanibaculum sp.]MCH2393219.1 hypothetical protein [Oceanibaculum sp.]